MTNVLTLHQRTTVRMCLSSERKQQQFYHREMTTAALIQKHGSSELAQ